MTNRKSRVALCMDRPLDLDAYASLIELVTHCRVVVRFDEPSQMIRKSVNSRSRLIVAYDKLVQEIDDWAATVEQLELHKLRAIIISKDSSQSSMVGNREIVRYVGTSQELIGALGAERTYRLDEPTELPTVVPSGLTAREREVWVSIAMGYSVAEVANELGLAESTVDSHKSKLMKKLNVRKSVDLARLAIRLGLVEV